MTPPRSTESGSAEALNAPGALARIALPIDALAILLLLFVWPERWEHSDHLPVQVPIALAGLFGVFLVGGYRLTLPIRRPAAFQAGLGLVCGCATGWLTLKLMASKFDVDAVMPPSLGRFSMGLVVVATLMTTARLLMLAHFRRREQAAPIVLLASAGSDTAKAIALRLQREHEHSPVIAVALDGLPEALKQPGLRALVLGIPPTGWPRETVEAVAIARAQGLMVTTPARFLEELFQRTPLDALDDPWLVLDEALTRRSPLYLGAKRALDVVLASVLLALGSPFFVLIALAVKLSGPGPIFYRQVRAGLHRKPFELLKFRTMRPDAEADTGPVWAAENDPRATRVGRLLRRSRLDELPQLINIIVGHMSLVGPRPERPELEHELAPRLPLYVLRHLAKPGLTGWAQVRLPYGASVEDAFAKLEHDLYYLKRASFVFDLAVLARTVPVILGLQGR